MSTEILETEDRAPAPVIMDIASDVDVSAPAGQRSAAGPRFNAMPRLIYGALQRHASVVRTIATSFAVLSLQLVQAPILARMLGRSGRGEYASAILYTTMLTYLGMAGCHLALARRAARGTESPIKLRRAALRTALMTGFATMAVVVVLAQFALPHDKMFLAPLCMICALVLPFEHSRLCLMGIEQGSGRFGRYNAALLMNAAVLPILLLILWRLGCGSVKMAALATIPGPIATLLFLWFIDGRWNPLGICHPRPVVLLKEGRPFALSVVVADIFGRLDMLLMLWLAPLAIQGCYAVAIPATGVLNVAPTALALFLFNAGARHDGATSPRKLWIAFAFAGAMQLFSALALAVCMKPLIIAVFGKEFEATVPLALALLPAQAFQGCTTLADGYLRGKNRSGVGVRSRIIAAVILIAGAFALFPRFKEMSVPISASIAAVVGTFLVAVALVREVRSSHMLESADPGRQSA